MTTPMFRAVPLAVALAALSLSACSAAGDKPKADAAKPATAAADAKAIPGLPTEKDQVSYMIGMEMAQSLQQVKGDVDVDVIAKAIRTVLAGEKPLMTEQQAAQVAQDFGQKMMARKQAEMQADAAKNLKAGEEFLAANAKKPGVVTLPSGLQYQVITAGSGPKPTLDSVVEVNYEGKLLDGKVFDSSYQRNEPATFPLNRVVPGWQEGLQQMPAGSTYMLWVPAKLGYGEMGTPGGPIPPNATLVFKVELIKVGKAPAK